MEVSSSVLEQDSSSTTPPPTTDPPHQSSTRKLGGWKSIAYIIGNVPVQCFFFFFLVFPALQNGLLIVLRFFVVFFVDFLKGTKPLRNWHR